MSPKISIIIPVYNVEKYLKVCLDSILKQTFKDWEAICVNDGSSDKSASILLHYIKKDSRFKIINQNNQGLSEARNNALKHAKGEYIFFLDSDDFVHPQLLEICYQLAKKENVKMVSFNYIRYLDKSSISFSNFQLNKLKYILTDSPLYFQKKCHKYKILTNTWSKMYKKDLIQDLSFIPHITMEDYPHTYAVLAKAPKTLILNIPFYYYRLNPTSIMSSDLTIKKIQDYNTGLNFIIKIYNHTFQKEKRFVLKKLIPNILKQQLNRIIKSPCERQGPLYEAFAKELLDLEKAGWLKPWGHKITRYLKYKKLIKTFNKKDTI